MCKSELTVTRKIMHEHLQTTFPDAPLSFTCSSRLMPDAFKHPDVVLSQVPQRPDVLGVNDRDQVKGAHGHQVPLEVRQNDEAARRRGVFEDDLLGFRLMR